MQAAAGWLAGSTHGMFSAIVWCFLIQAALLVCAATAARMPAVCQTCVVVCSCLSKRPQVMCTWALLSAAWLPSTNRPSQVCGSVQAADHAAACAATCRHIATACTALLGLQVVDMPLLFETGSHKLASLTVVVACNPELQVGNRAYLQLHALLFLPLLSSQLSAIVR